MVFAAFNGFSGLEQRGGTGMWIEWKMLLSRRRLQNLITQRLPAAADVSIFNPRLLNPPRMQPAIF